MKIIGITGSMGSGKSTTARMLASFKVPLWDADKEVKLLFLQKFIQEKIALLLRVPLENLHIQKEIVKRIETDSLILEKIEQLLQPYMVISRENFMKKNYRQRRRYVAWDIPLLFERKRDILCDAVWVIAASPVKRAQRIKKRPCISPGFYDFLQKRQMKDQKKRARGQVVIYSGSGRGAMFRHITSSLNIIYRKKNDGSSQTRNYIGC